MILLKLNKRSYFQIINTIFIRDLMVFVELERDWSIYYDNNILICQKTRGGVDISWRPSHLYEPTCKKNIYKWLLFAVNTLKTEAL